MYTHVKKPEQSGNRNDLDPAQKALLAQNVADNTADQTDEEFYQIN